MAKNGWGAAKEGKTIKEQDYTHGFKPQVKSSKDLNGMYGTYQGKTLDGHKSNTKD